MRERHFLLTAIAVLAVASFANASIIGWNCDDDGDGAIVMNSPTWTEIGGEYHLSMTGKQYWDPAHVQGDFTTDTPLDPTVWIAEDVENYTGFIWTDYHIGIGMTKTFTIGDGIHTSGTGSQYGIIAPSDWTWTISGPTGGQPIPNGGTGWFGTVDYFAGTAIPSGPGNVGSFGLKVAFIGSVAFCPEQYPTPEPATLAILGLGGMALLRRRSA
jgi:hypothetical protein